MIPQDALCEVSVSRAGFTTWHSSTRIQSSSAICAVLQPAILAQEIIVSAGSLAATPEIVARTPGAVEVLDPTLMRSMNLMTFDEALRKIPGLYARSEEGFSLRPNISIRGLNPTRSSQVLLLEDGVPLAYAPYGDNASYYHPPIDRFESIEVVKGSGQIAYGPRTVGGVINYITPPVPDRPSTSLTLTGGSRDYLNAHIRHGATYRRVGFLLDAVRKQGEGARDNVRSGISDLNAKALYSASTRHALSLKGNHYGEDSRVTYSGLRLDEWLASARQNPFRNDSFDGSRSGASLAHTWIAASSAILTTTAYGSVFRRDWWRQSSNSNQRPNDAADPLCGGMANLHTTCGNEGRLRSYSAWGVEPRLSLTKSIAGLMHQLDAGFRTHFEIQERLQVNGDTPLARAGRTVENNRRGARALSFFLQDRIQFGSLTLSPGIRFEQVRYERTNRLFDGGAGITGATSLRRSIPGIGLAWSPSSRVTVFAGAHRGFAPPRVEDVINNSGGFVELEPELSWNTEAGVRLRPARAFSLESTFFRLDFSNQIIPASLAGGVGATLTNGGRTLHQGGEFSGRYEFHGVLGSGNTLLLRAAWTWLPVARFQGVRYSSVSGFSNVLIAGNRLPYASASLGNAMAGFTHRTGVNLMLEMVQTARQFGDDLNTVNSTLDGQRGALPGHVLWNASLNVPLEAQRAVLFFTVKNAADRLVLVDRARGMLPGPPRLIQAGMRFSF